jgi:hypothetical protein
VSVAIAGDPTPLPIVLARSASVAPSATARAFVATTV